MTDSSITDIYVEPVVIDLRPWEYQAACDVGIRRYTANWERADAAHYERHRMEDDRTATVAAAICELAVARALNRYWHGHVWPISEHRKWHRTLADVGRSIEVRRVRDSTTQDVAVRRSDLDRSLTLVAAYAIPPEFRTVEVWGSLPADAAWEAAEVRYDTYRRVHRRHLRAIDPATGV